MPYSNSQRLTCNPSGLTVACSSALLAVTVSAFSPAITDSASVGNTWPEPVTVTVCFASPPTNASVLTTNCVRYVVAPASPLHVGVNRDRVHTRGDFSGVGVFARRAVPIQTGRFVFALCPVFEFALAQRQTSRGALA